MKTILCFNADPELEVNRREFDGVRRFADTCGWRLLFFNGESSSDDSASSLVARHRPDGCIVGPNTLRRTLPARVFGRTPVVWLVPRSEVGWRGATCVTADNAAIAGAAFRELAAGLSKCFATVPSRLHPRWSAERIGEFRRLCRETGVPCRVFPARRSEAEATRLARLRNWVAALPLRCAVFAVNDFVAYDVAAAARAIPRHIPKELVLIGVDALTASSDDSRLADISSVEVDFEGAGYTAAKMLAKLMEGACRPSCATFGPLLVLRRRSTQGRGSRDPDILGAIDIIRREACDGLTAAKLAARFPGSRKHFERRFRLVMGHSILDEILHVRFEKAKTLLVQTDLPLDDIAAQCGFGTETNLRKHFHLRDGTSPRQWRRDHTR